MSKIEWTERTWNPIRGCSRVSEGCENCYAETMAGRFSGPGGPYEGLVSKTSKGFRWTGKIHVVEKEINAPYRWKKPQMVFVNSMSDLYHANLEDKDRWRIYKSMKQNPKHTFQVLTKRPENIPTGILDSMPDNVWIGTSVEDNSVKARIAHLIRVRAKTRFLSVEPMLGPLEIDDYLSTGLIHWVIIGGESGPGARKCNLDWKKDLIKQCDKYNVSVFVKQLGSNSRYWPDDSYKGSDISKWPEWLQRREYPIAA